MSAKSLTSKWKNILVGLFLILFAIGLGATGNYYAIGFAGLMFIFGLIIFLVGVYQKPKRQLTPPMPMGQFPQGYAQPIIIQAPPSQAPVMREVTREREIVKVRCRSCNATNFETANRCTNCGASL